jgi:flagellar biosynthesis protein FlhB
MADSQKSMVSIVAIIAIVILVGFVIYFIMQESNDSIIEIDLGSASDAAPAWVTPAASAAPAPVILD